MYRPLDLRFVGDNELRKNPNKWGFQSVRKISVYSRGLSGNDADTSPSTDYDDDDDDFDDDDDNSVEIDDIADYADDPSDIDNVTNQASQFCCSFHLPLWRFMDLEGGSQKATLVVVVLVVGISSPRSKNS